MERIDVVHEACKTQVISMKVYGHYHRGLPPELTWWCPSCRRDVESFEIMKRYCRWEPIKRENLW